jgi:hypothetical protein
VAPATSITVPSGKFFWGQILNTAGTAGTCSIGGTTFSISITGIAGIVLGPGETYSNTSNTKIVGAYFIN